MTVYMRYRRGTWLAEKWPGPVVCESRAEAEVLAEACPNEWEVYESDEEET